MILQGRGRGKELWVQVAVKAISRYKVIGKDAQMCSGGRSMGF
jgi:hypothetical protein